MHRHRRRLAVIVCLRLLSHVATAQEPTLSGLARQPDGTALSGAEVLAFPVGWDVVGLEGWATPEAQATTTNERGEFRMVPGAPSRCLIRHASGLGATIARLDPGAPQRVTVEPMAEIRLPPGATCALVRVVDGAEDDGWLGRHQGPSVRLPAGTYRVLTQGAVSEHRVVTRSGDTVQLFSQADPRDPTVRGQLVRLSRVQRVIVDGWHQLPLPLAREESVRLWPSHLDPAPRQLILVAAGPGDANAYVHLQSHSRADEVTVPDWQWQSITVPGGARGTVATLQTIGDSVRCLALSPVEKDDTAQVPRCPGCTRVVLGTSIAGFAGDATQLALPPSGDVRVQVVDASGPVPDAVLELSGPLPQVRRRGRTDARGHATLAGVPRSAAVLELRARAHWVAPQAISAEQIGSGRVTLHAEPGAGLAGRITLAGRALGALLADVSLRDTTAVLGMQPRHARPAGDGHFAFEGLDPDGRYTLFASAQVNGITYSAKLHGVLPGTDVTLDLQSEDVPPPFRR